MKPSFFCTFDKEGKTHFLDGRIFFRYESCFVERKINEKIRWK